MNSHHFRTCSAVVASCFCAVWLHADLRRVDPTFLHRNLSAVEPTAADVSTSPWHYKPLFGAGDSNRSIVVGIARYGEVIIDPNGACASRNYPEEDQVYVVLEGSGSVRYGRENVPLKKEDYLYLPATVPHALSNRSGVPLKVIIMGFRTAGFEKAPLPTEPLKANIEEV